MLAHTRADVHELNETARARLRAEGALGEHISVQTNRGQRELAEGDRFLFLRNERSLGVKNGMLGTVEKIDCEVITVRADDGRQLRVDTAEYKDFDHGYAVTIHKAQGVTVSQSFVFASEGFDRHLSYVSGSRHRDDLTIFYSEERFKTPADFARVLSFPAWMYNIREANICSIKMPCRGMSKAIPMAISTGRNTERSNIAISPPPLGIPHWLFTSPSGTNL